MACVTEEGRILEFAEWYKGGDILEFSNGTWGKPLRPVSSSEEFKARTLSAEEVADIEKFGKLI